LIFQAGLSASPKATTLVAAWYKPPTFSRFSFRWRLSPPPPKPTAFQAVVV
jgi:hypothetical protein